MDRAGSRLHDHAHGEAEREGEVIYAIMAAYLAVGFIIGGVYAESIDDREMSDGLAVMLFMCGIIWPVFLCVTLGIYTTRWFKGRKPPQAL